MDTMTGVRALRRTIHIAVSYTHLIIRAIAAGSSRLSAISGALEVKATSLTKYLKTLIDLDILERELSLIHI